MMEQLKKLENTVENWLEPMPHLPVALRKWMGENTWWIAMIGVSVSVIVIFKMILNLLAPGLYSYVAAIDGFGYLSSIIILVSMAISVALVSMSIAPLKERMSRGWELLFIVFVINMFAALVCSLLTTRMIMLVPSLMRVLGLAWAGSYLLFEMRTQFSKDAPRGRSRRQ